MLPKSHWKLGQRPIAIGVEDAEGRPLASDHRIAGYFLDAQRTGLAPPSKELNRLWLLLPFAGPAATLGGLAAPEALTRGMVLAILVSFLCGV